MSGRGYSSHRFSSVESFVKSPATTNQFHRKYWSISSTHSESRLPKHPSKLSFGRWSSRHSAVLSQLRLVNSCCQFVPGLLSHNYAPAIQVPGPLSLNRSLLKSLACGAHCLHRQALFYNRSLRRNCAEWFPAWQLPGQRYHPWCPISGDWPPYQSVSCKQTLCR